MIESLSPTRSAPLSARTGESSTERKAGREARPQRWQVAAAQSAFGVGNGSLYLLHHFFYGEKYRLRGGARSGKRQNRANCENAQTTPPGSYPSSLITGYK
jgi:hypothetical protein